jgi:hypothetical protein
MAPCQQAWCSTADRSTTLHLLFTRLGAGAVEAGLGVKQ